ncbi:O-antigen ligase family protein [Geodermatophilus marinus]|uniref:O-antigen ligase family protein n=1 Tax=Geodermatophilus sp. LHW52908 TaxID=2303986 RepID=UPI000E3E901E|nr:O-antigen ligase family protein [Geodermatophilus sp. LHW52908]RFU21276.1 hypothetical protein D0Z06_10840 [Geodermatophilus sp. LHW52908]
MTVVQLVAVALAPLLVVYVVACFRDPLRYALPPYAVLLPFSSLVSIGPGPFGSVSSLQGLLLGSALVAQLATSRRSAPRIALSVPVWLAFVALCGFSVYWSVAPLLTVQNVLVLASLVLLFVALALTRFDPLTLRRFENSIVLGGGLVVCYGLAQLLFLGGLPAPDGRGARFGNDLLGANLQAAFLLFPIAIVAARALTGPPRARVANVLVMLLLLFGLLMTGSRGGLLSLVVVLGVITLLASARLATKNALAAIAVVLLVGVLVLNPAGIGQRQLQGTDSSGRADIWTVGWQACLDHCATGAGWGSFPRVYADQLSSVPEARVLHRGTTWEAHNIFLLAVVEVGVAGVLLVLLGLGLALRSAVRLPPSLRAPPLATLLGTVLSSFFLSSLNFKFFWIVLAYVAVSETVAITAREHTVIDAPRPASVL